MNNFEIGSFMKNDLVLNNKGDSKSSKICIKFFGAYATPYSISNFKEYTKKFPTKITYVFYFPPNSS